jgi:Uncharacterized conserved protein
MKLCIPSVNEEGLDSYVHQHFGRCPYYALIDDDTGEVKVFNNTSEHLGGVGLPPELIKKYGVDIMLCAGLGPKAVGMFEDLGITVYVGAAGTIRDAVEQWRSNKLQLATFDNACKDHGH